MSTTSATATGAFYTLNGQIIGPNGQPFVARGINVMEGNQPSVSTLMTDFPGINFVRLAIYDYANPTALASYVNALTAQGIVVELEDHSNNAGNAGGSSGTIYTGSTLTTELNWYSSIATAFKNNPYVWFGTNNEPSETDSSGKQNPAALSTWQQQTYQAIRNTGNTNPILMEMNSWGPTQTGTGYTSSVYAGMTNIIWDVHYYGWLSGYSTNQSTVSSTLSAIVAATQQFKSADGTVPVLIGEYGNSTTGLSIDANADQVLTAVQQSGLSSAAWAWGVGNPGDGLSDGGTGLSAYGQEVAAWIKSQAGTGSGSSASASANNTVVMGTTGAITDASGNIWTITTGGQVAVNGITDTTTANVIELAYVNGTIWHENASKMWWGKTSPTAAWGPNAGTATSPLPAGVTPSANNTVVLAGSTAAITDGSGNKWTITSTAQVAVNGTTDTTTANVIELAYVNGTVWQENTSKMWWGKTSPTGAWSPNAGTATSPLPAVITPSANNTVVLAGSMDAITDAGGNKWTITSGAQVAVNGTTDTTTANVIELAYVNGTIWHENASKMWWGKTSPTAAWGPNAGTATSPLPAVITPSDNDTVIMAGSTAAITDASGNKWTITSTAQVAVNGTTDTTTANVIELAYVNGTVWQENASKMWWGKTSPTAAWGPNAGTATSPLPSSITIAATQTTATISASQISVISTSGDHTVFISGSGDTVNLSGGTNTITDTGKSNTYVIPAAGKGYDIFTSNILANGETLDLRTALAATNWNGTTVALSKYLTVTNSSQGAVLSISATAGGSQVALATINGATTANLSTLLAHAIT